MFLGDINVLSLLFMILIFNFIVNVTTSLNLIIIAELIWITLFCLALLFGLINDNINVISLTFFFLVLSSIEFGIGLILILCQNTFFKSINLNDNDSNFTKYNTRTKLNLVINKYLF